ncbi:MAG: hypothetical protein NTV22_01200 [bacterium]|nr:hypothetical protein [bacterium]
MNSKLNERELLNILMHLLDRTTPHGMERTLAHLLPAGGIWDMANNYIVEVGTGSTSLFACHLDTVCDERVKLKPRVHQGMIYSAKHRSPLGADDKAGVLCLCAMIHANIPGVYIFHSGEECGGIGARHIADSCDLTRFKRAVEFDRKGLNSVITKMGWDSTCSHKFADALCDQLGMGFCPDPTGIFTDVYNYTDTIPEVTNVSVGYYNHHTNKETLNASWLINKLIPRLYQVDWEHLPIERDPSAYKAQWEMDYQWTHSAHRTSTYDIFDDDLYRQSHLRGTDIVHGCDYECEMCGGLTNNPDFLQEVTLETGDMYWLCKDCTNYIKRDVNMHEVNTITGHMHEDDGHMEHEQSVMLSSL